MRQGNHNTARWTLAVAVLVVLVSGGILMGSNMGFKFNMPLELQSGIPPQGDNVMSFPYLVPYADRQCLCDSLGLVNASTVVQQFDALTGGFTFYQCGQLACGTCAAANCALDTTNAVWLTDNSIPTSVIVVGAHDPTANIALVCQPVGNNAPSGDNWVSIPYHSTSSDTEELCQEMGLTVGAFVTLNDAATGGFALYSCGNVGFELALTKGESVIVNLDPASGDCLGGGITNWVPSHF